MEARLNASLASALDGDEWSASFSGSFTAGGRWNRREVGHRGDVGVVAKRKIPPVLGIKRRSSIP
jgi:hypothetical protein